MRPISDLLQKHHGIWSLHPQETVFAALKTLADHNVGALMVMDAGRLVGVFSERDYTRKVALAGKNSRELKVQDIMTTQVISVAPSTSTDECMALMSQRKIRHLPIVDGTRVMGMVSIRDLMDEILQEREDTIQHLQTYIAG
ncbi:CBS domain-containing protein [Curvibacter sp. CHRR-16]|uniref:CBS domain-containing protein n=1 Tax=Curvibacter sp. CHRR-16 TaxID=2835872 RepID=UPI001BD99922|nr:CBS domain-containing protein [Curvibacter sp. CHRR-16]MBT0569986.1 CBS domain-containing protein [Curvibacter sp. CHRR-16]